jgi:hypothetical protein
VYLALSCAGALAYGALRHWEAIVRFDGATATAAAAVVGGAVWDAGSSLVLLLLFGLAFSTAFLACVARGSAWALARATGPESRDLIAQVECEPVPSGVRAVLETLALESSEEDLLTSSRLMRHSFHELPTARARVARAIEDWLAPASDETRALNEGGRARALILNRWVEAHRDVFRAGGQNARRQVQELVDRALAADGPVTAFQLIDLMRPLLPERDHGALDSVAIDLGYAAIQGNFVAHRRELDQVSVRLSSDERISR